MNKRRLLLLLLILMAWALRLLLLGKQSLWYDEGVTWMLSQMPLPDLINWTAADIQPPLYYLLIWVSEIIIDDSEWALRFPSVIFSVATVPLVYSLACRLFRASRFRATPSVAALLCTLSPVMIYYSQEARMYTLLAFEATLATYLLFKLLYPDVLYPVLNPATLRYGLRLLRMPRFNTNIFLYILVATAALYTHYFAAFLLMTQLIYTLFILWQRHFPKADLQRLSFSFGGCLLLFMPWLPTLLARLGDDPSYWPGALKLDEAIRKVAISFSVGETVFEETAQWLALGYLLILLGGGLWAFFQSRNSSQGLRGHRSVAGPAPFDTPRYSGCRPHNHNPHSSRITSHESRVTPSHTLLFLSLWLLLPLLLILALSYSSPKFNPRYTLLSWPAFTLLLSAALSQFHPTPYALRLTPYAPHLTFYVLRFTFYLFLLSTTAFSLFNWFTDPRFSKADFKALAQFVRERKGGDETVLLSSGHMFPVWAYYYGWDGWTPLPWMLRLDVNQVTGLDIAETLAEALKDQGGVWLVTWQAEVIDPSGVVPFWLDRIGRRPIDAGDFWGVGLEHWRLDPAKKNLLDESPIQRPANLNFAGQVELVGLTQLNDTDLALFWRAQQPLPDDLLFTLDLTDPEGFSWDKGSVTGRPGSYLYPPSRWPVGETVMTRHTLTWQLGAPPGLYLAEVGLGRPDLEEAGFAGWDILDEQSRPQRRTARLEFVNLSHLVRPEGGPLPQARSPVVDFFPIIGVRRTILPEKMAEPGDRVLLALLWQAGEYNLDDITIAFDLVDAQGQTHRLGSSLTPSRRFNLPRWRPGDMVLGQYWLNIPPEAAPGLATLQLHLINSSGFRYHEIFPLDQQLEILPAQRNFTPPQQLDIPLEANFSQKIALLGADCPAGCRALPGQTVGLTLHWRAEAPSDLNYTVFTHLLGPDETVLANADHAPPKPTQGWVPGEIITDPVKLAIPGDLPPGAYTIEVGLYDASDPAFTRLPLAEGEDRVILPKPLTIE